MLTTRTPVVVLIRRVIISLILVGALSSVAGAYTLVLRDGRRVEIPAQFTLSKTTLTYEAGQGINVTLLLAVVDIAATEKVNHEIAGGFLSHATKIRVPEPVRQTGSAHLTITNLDLEPARQTRIESERAYERRRKELGLPSVEESRRRQAADEEEVLALARGRARDLAGAENYWRERAGLLREEIRSTDAQINYLRARLAAFGEFPLATNSLVTSVLPLVPLANRSAVVMPNAANPAVFFAPSFGPQLRGRVTFEGGNLRGRVVFNASPFPARGFGYGGFPAYQTGGPFDSIEGSYERAGLIERLDSLLVSRTGLSARRIELEDEAREARVPQVWLEP